ncbi:MAG: DNA-directed RNA polymerase subunit alpha C-terminal domain-containing protein, partial [Candidatus Nanopelagicaceae bacterium]
MSEVPRDLTGWVAGYVSANQDEEDELRATGICDEATYLLHEQKLSRERRKKIGIYRFYSLISNRDDPQNIVACSPPWLRDMDISSLPLTVRLQNVIFNFKVTKVSELEKYSIGYLLSTPNCGKKSIRDLNQILLSLLAEGPMDLASNRDAIEKRGILGSLRMSLLSFDAR